MSSLGSVLPARPAERDRVRRNPLPAVRDRIHTARAQRRWTQARLAQALGVSPSTISKWERGATRPDPEQRAALARPGGQLRSRRLASNSSLLISPRA
ncbi:MAG TPA: helix-turn-helix transcriptional regulator [Methylomirabilota bacterium]|nr:helix-turn-helix transcriptional regulator [Methylomirabilota bacterium]